MKAFFLQLLLFSCIYSANATPSFVKDTTSGTKKNKKQICENCSIQLDTIKIHLKDSIQKIHFNKKFNAITSEYQDSLFKVIIIDSTREEFIKFKEKITDFYIKSTSTIVTNKNELVFEQFDCNKELCEKLDRDGINYKLIIFLILLAGIIGGWARTNWHLLDYIENTINELKKQLEKYKELIPPTTSRTKKDIGAAEMLFSVQNENRLEKMNTIKEKLITVEAEIKKSKKDEKRPLKMLTNIAFGVIASSISVLALYAVDSKLLDFEKTIHYFVFWGWCVLGAVFAKDWVERGYKIISSRWNKTNE